MKRSARITAIALSALVSGTGLSTLANSASASTPAGDTSHSRLGFVVNPAYSGTGALPNSLLATVDGTGSDYRPVTLSGATALYPSQPAYSHDGKHIAFTALTGSDTDTAVVALFVANVDGSDTHVVVPDVTVAGHMITRLAWSPDDSTLYLGVDRDANTTPPVEVWQVQADGTGFEPVPGLPHDGSLLQIDVDVLADGRLAFNDGNGHVVVFDPRTKTSSTVYSNLQGQSPFELSPDGTRIAVVQSQELVVSALDGTGAQNLTKYTSLPVGAKPMAWSPDGTELAFETSAGTLGDGLTIHDVTGARSDAKVAAPAGSAAGTTMQTPAWAPAPASPTPPPGPTPTPTPPAAGQPTVHRIGGDTRYDTARKVSAEQWAAGRADAVVLARGDQAPDALAGVPLAAHVHGPLLLTDPAALDTGTRNEIDRVLGGPATHKTIYILGGANAVSPTIEARLRTAGYTVVRYGGQTRFETALKVAAVFGPTSHVIVATGRDFPDALSAGPLGAAEGAPIVLSDDKVLDPQTAAFVQQHQAIDPIGGQAQRAVQALHTTGKTIDLTLAGPDRYATSAAVAARVADRLGHVPTVVGVASGTAFPDALTGGAYIANAAGALLLTDPAALSDPARGELHGWVAKLSAVEVFGGTSAVSAPVFSAVVSAVGGRVV